MRRAPVRMTDAYVRCPECGYRTHVDANCRADGWMTCQKCYHVFEIEEGD